VFAAGLCATLNSCQFCQNDSNVLSLSCLIRFYG